MRYFFVTTHTFKRLNMALMIQNGNNKTKWIWIYDREKRRYSAIKDHKMRYKTIKRPQYARPHMTMAVKSNKTIWGQIRPNKAIQGHIKPYKANTTIQCHNVPQMITSFWLKGIFFVPLHIFCSLAHFLFDLGLFCSWFHAKKKKKKKKKKKNNNNLF